MGNRHPKPNRHRVLRFMRTGGASPRQRPAAFRRQEPPRSPDRPPMTILLPGDEDEANRRGRPTNDDAARGFKCYQLSVNPVGHSRNTRARGMGNKTNVGSEPRLLLHKIHDGIGQPSDAIRAGNAQKFSYLSLQRTPKIFQNSMALSQSRRAVAAASPGTNRQEGEGVPFIPSVHPLHIDGRRGAASSNSSQRREDEFVDKPYRREQGHFQDAGHFQGRNASPSPMAGSSFAGQKREDEFEPGYFHGRQANPASSTATYPQRWGSAFQPYRQYPMTASPVASVTPSPQRRGNGFQPYPGMNQGGIIQRLKSRMRRNFISRKVNRARRYSTPNRGYGFAPNWSNPTMSRPIMQKDPQLCQRCCCSSNYPNPSANCMTSCNALNPPYGPREERQTAPIGSNPQSRMRNNFHDRRDCRQWERMNAGQRSDAALDARASVQGIDDHAASPRGGFDDRKMHINLQDRRDNRHYDNRRFESPTNTTQRSDAALDARTSVQGIDHRAASPRGGFDDRKMHINLQDRRDPRFDSPTNATQRSDAALDTRMTVQVIDNHAGGGFEDDTEDMTDALSHFNTTISTCARTRKQRRKLEARRGSREIACINRPQVVRNEWQPGVIAKQEKASLNSLGSGTLTLQGSSSSLDIANTYTMCKQTNDARSADVVRKSVVHRYSSDEQHGHIELSPTGSHFELRNLCGTCKEEKAGAHDVIKSYLTQTMPKLEDQRKDRCSTVDRSPLNSICACNCAKSRQERTLHGSDCLCRPVHCPDHSCKFFVKFKELLPHIQKSHLATQWLGEIRPHHLSKQYWNIRSGENFSAPSNSWVLTVWRYSGQTFVTIFEKRDEKWYVWLYLVGNKELAQSYEYQIRLRKTDDASKTMIYKGVAHAIDERKSDIRGKKDCLILTDKAVRAFMTRKGMSSERQKQGYDYRLPLEFKIKEKQHPPR